MAKQSSKPSFEQQLERLEDIVELLDRGETPLEEMIAKYEEGTALLEKCRTLLENAEQKITTIQRKTNQESSVKSSRTIAKEENDELTDLFS